jgi:hypothetical protein
VSNGTSENSPPADKFDRKNNGRDWSPFFAIIAGIACILLWLWFFSLGFTYTSYALPPDPGKATTAGAVAGSSWSDLPGWAGEIFLFTMIWRWTNVLYLTIFASIVGEVGKWANSRTSRGKRQRPSYEGAIVRGFYVFLLALTGQVIIAGGAEPDRASQTTATIAANGTKLPPQSSVSYVDESRYFRLAGAASLLGFMGSCFPGFFRKLLDRYNPEDQGSGSLPSGGSTNNAERDRKPRTPRTPAITPQKDGENPNVGG